MHKAQAAGWARYMHVSTAGGAFLERELRDDRGDCRSGNFGSRLSFQCGDRASAGPGARVRLGCERLWVRRFTSGSRSAAIVDDERAVRCKRAPRPGIPTGRGLGNPPSSASKLFLVMRAPPTRTRTRISNQAGLLAASGGLGGCNARRGAASSRMTDRPSTGQIGEWCFARQTLMEGRPVSRWQRLSTARALHSIGARRLRRVGREWIWRLD
jgi:hypothetical protein